MSTTRHDGKRKVIHRHLVTACRAAGLRQKRLCELASVAWWRWRKALQGEVVFTAAEVERLALLLKIPAEAFPRELRWRPPVVVPPDLEGATA